MKVWQQSSKTDNELIAGPQVVRVEMTPEEAQSLYISIEFDSPYTAQRQLHAAMREWFATHG